MDVKRKSSRNWPQKGDMYFSNLRGSSATYLNPVGINTPELYAGVYYPPDAMDNPTWFAPGKTRAQVCAAYPGSPS